MLLLCWCFEHRLVLPITLIPSSHLPAVPEHKAVEGKHYPVYQAAAADCYLVLTPSSVSSQHIYDNAVERQHIPPEGDDIRTSSDILSTISSQTSADALQTTCTSQPSSQPSPPSPWPCQHQLRLPTTSSASSYPPAPTSSSRTCSPDRNRISSATWITAPACTNSASSHATRSRMPTGERCSSSRGVERVLTKMIASELRPARRAKGARSP
jgi:hypothetical protein